MILSGFVIVTHPFHPLNGQRLEVLYSKRRGADTVFVCSGGVSGQITLPLAWTDRGEPPLAPPAVGRGPGRARHAGPDTARSLIRVPACTAFSCVMNAHKNDLRGLTTPQLLARRRAAAARLGDVEQVLAGTLTEQSRRCGRPGCRCADGEPHGPYAYFTPRPAGRGRARYVPAALAEVVRRYLRRGEQAEAVLAEISAINAELLARRELQ